MKTSSRRAVLLRAAILATMPLLLVACVAPGGSGGGTGSGSELSRALAGRTFLSTATTGRDLVPGSRVRISFTEDAIAANAGCNSMGGAYTVRDGLIAATGLMMTEMACEPALMEQDTWLAALIGGARATLEGDTLTLAGTAGAAKDTTVTLLDRRVADPDRPLEGTTWVLDSIVTGATASSVPAGVRASLRIEGGTAAVEFGCNRGGGPATTEGSAIAFGALASTKMACLDPGKAETEAAMQRFLTGLVPYAISATTLTLGAAGGDQLVFRAEE
jgi:heat shock protein HslJ